MSHVLKDNYLAGGLVRAAQATWPEERWEGWHHYASGKKASMPQAKLPAAVQVILAQLAELSVHRMVGCEPAFPDLDRLHGAGLHEMGDGSTLGLHLDTERHPVLPWRREATAILYLDECSGGELDLTTSDGTSETKIAPMPNRLLVFSTPGQYHRVNECNSLRRSICLFFWSICDDWDSGCRRANFV